ncbi:MAG: inosine-5'-monophosphate dehydrogenase [Gammaproteobacteria bacterium]|jgi:IMP dehydrogenase|nr:MAG: inosine-5'-monophosphate dehydrogenase [Gammaproteobacteria bacterium]
MDKVKAKALTFDDVLLVPSYCDFLPSQASVKTSLTKNIDINLPLLSAAMDTVTEYRMAIALAEAGGMGILHKNCSIQEQSNAVRNVKKYESGVVRDPTTISSKQTIGQLKQLTGELNISGMPVVDDGVVKGIVTSRDFRYADNMDDLVESIMTPREKLITVLEGTSQEVVKKMMYENRIEKVLVLDKAEKLTGLVTMKDIEKSEKHPNATKDDAGQLRVGAAIGTGAETFDRAKSLADSGVDLFVVDSAHGHTKSVIETVKMIKKEFPTKDVIAGNVATPEGAEALIEAGADGIKIGMGPGSICTTRIIAGIGVPQISAILTIYEKVKGKVPLIADGGMRYSGDIAKAIAAGADSVMLGSIFAGTEEAPGEFELYQGRSFKTYRGMGSLGAMSKRDDSNRYFQEDIDAEKLVPEGVEGRVPYKGWAINVINQLIGGLRQSMGYVGCKNIQEMKENSRFVEITNAGMTESHVHDVQITKEAPNYQRS